MQLLRNTGSWSVRKLSHKFNCTEETVEVYTTETEMDADKAKKAFNAKFDGMKWTEKVRIVNRIRRKAFW